MQPLTLPEGLAEKPQRGFSLIEVIVALGLLGGVMLGVSGLFVQGANSIKGGKDTTAALAQATDIAEDLSQLSYRRLYSSFGGVDSDTSLQADTRDGSSFVRGWQTPIEEAVWQGYALIDLVPIGIDSILPACAASPPTVPNFGCGQGIRAVITVHWDERGRDQELSLGFVRF